MTKGPFVRERLMTEGTSGWSMQGVFADVRYQSPFRRAHLASVSGVGSVTSSPRRSRPARGGVCDTRCPERSGSGRSLGHEQSWSRVSSIGCSAPDPEHLWRQPRTEGDFRSNRAVVPTADPVVEMSGWTVVVLVETSTCRSRRSVRGLDLRRESGVTRGLVGAFGRRQKTRGHCPGRPAGAGCCEGLSQGRPPRSRAMEGTSVPEEPPSLTCPR